MQSSKKRILYIWQTRYPWDVRVEKICSSLVEKGFEVEVLARRAEGEPSRVSRDSNEKGFAIHRVGTSTRWLRPLSLPIPGNPVWFFAIRGRIREFRPDLVIVRDIPLALPAAGACRRARIPWVIDMAEHYPVAMRTWKKYQRNPFTRFAINTLKIPDWIERRSVLLAHGILPVIDEQKDRLVREYGCDPAIIVPVLNTPERGRLPGKIDGKRKAFSFGYHGVVIQDRDLPTVVRGFDIAAAKNAEMTLTIAGEGESMTDVRCLVDQSPYKDRINLTGKRFRPEDVAALYAGVDYGIVPWTVNDFTNNTIANKFFDYAAFGKPILFSETRPMVRLMESMKFGIGYRGGDPESCASAMLKLVAAHYEKLAMSGRTSVEREFNWDVDCERMVGFLNALLGQTLS